MPSGDFFSLASSTAKHANGGKMPLAAGLIQAVLKGSSFSAGCLLGCCRLSDKQRFGGSQDALLRNPFSRVGILPHHQTTIPKMVHKEIHSSNSVKTTNHTRRRQRGSICQATAASQAFVFKSIRRMHVTRKPGVSKAECHFTIFITQSRPSSSKKKCLLFIHYLQTDARRRR